MRYVSNITAYPPRLVLTFHVDVDTFEPIRGSCFAPKLGDRMDQWAPLLRRGMPRLAARP